MAKKLIIAITGTPAVGKTTFAKELSGSIPDPRLIEINDVVEQYKLFSSIDKMGSKIVKLKQLENKIQEIVSENRKTSNILIVGHLVPELELKQDMTIVLRASLKELIKREEERGYPKEKIKENIVSESIDYFGVKSRELTPETYEIETKEQKSEIIDYIKSILAGKSIKQPDKEEISKLNELLELIMEGNTYGF